MSVFQEKILEPKLIYTGSIFKIKIKTIRYVTYEELAKKTYEQVKEFSYSELKGE